MSHIKKQPDTQQSQVQGIAPAGRLRHFDSTERFSIGIVLVALFGMGIFFGCREIISPDLGFHLSSAQWILEHGAIPSQDIFTYTISQRTYIDLQWTYQLVVYGFNLLFGPSGIVGLTTVLTMLFSATLLWRVYRRQEFIPLAAVGLLVLFFLGNLWEIRPHLFSWVYGSLLLLALEEYDRGNRRWLWLLPVVMLLWVNAHSLYVLGLVSIATYVFSDLVNGWRVHRKLRGDKRLVLWSLIAVLVCLINPYHIKGLMFPVSQFFLIQGQTGYKSTLTGTVEFLSPFRLAEYWIDGRFVLLQPLLWWQLTAVLAVLGMMAQWKQRRLCEWLMFLGFLYIFHSASKNYGYFVMACFPMVTSGLHHVSMKISQALVKGLSPRIQWLTLSRVRLLTCGKVAVLCVLLSLAAGSNWLYDVSWLGTSFGTGFNRDALPVGACQFIQEHGIQGRIINCWDDGGYIGWVTQQKVFINSEGNTMGLAFYDEYVRAREPEGFAQALAKWKPSVAVVRYDITPYWLFHLHNIAKNWRMVYADDFVAVFLDDTVALEVSALPEPVAGQDYPQYEKPQIEQIVRQAAAAPKPGLIPWLQGSAAYPLEEIRRSSYYLHTNRTKACIATAVQGLERTLFLVPELMLNLGHAFNAQRQYILADLCYDAFMRADDNPVMAQEISMQRQARRR